MVKNMKPTFINVPFKHNLACAIQKWLIFKRVVITVRLTYISQKYFLIDLKQSHYCFLSLAYL